MPIRVMLADDSEVIRFLYTKALERDGDIQVVASVGNGIAAIEMAKLHQPDGILLDIEMPKMDGLSALPLLQAAAPHSKIIIVSGRWDAKVVLWRWTRWRWEHATALSSQGQAAPMRLSNSTMNCDKSCACCAPPQSPPRVQHLHWRAPTHA